MGSRYVMIPHRMDTTAAGRNAMACAGALAEACERAGIAVFCASRKFAPGADIQITKGCRKALATATDIVLIVTEHFAQDTSSETSTFWELDATMERLTKDTPPPRVYVVRACHRLPNRPREGLYLAAQVFGFDFTRMAYIDGQQWIRDPDSVPAELLQKLGAAAVRGRTSDGKYWCSKCNNRGECEVDDYWDGTGWKVSCSGTHSPYGCAAAHVLSAVRFPSYGGLPPLWRSAREVVAFAWRRLPGLAQWPQAPAPGPEPWLPAALSACARDHVRRVGKLAQADPTALAALLAGGAGLAAAARLGNRRAVAWLLARGAAPVDTAPGRGPCEEAAAGLFLPALELLWGRPCAAWGESDWASLRLPRESVNQLRAAAAWYVDFVSESAEDARAIDATEVGLRQTRCQRITEEAIEGAHRGPTSLAPHPEQARRDFEAATTRVSPEAPIDAYLIHTSEDFAGHSALKAARIQSAVGPEETVLFDLLCTPQWDIAIKSQYVRGFMSHFLRTAERCVLVVTPRIFTKWWPMEELLTFAKLHGYGSIHLAATEEDIPDGDVRAYIERHLPASVEEFGATGGMNRPMLQSLSCTVVEACDKEHTKAKSGKMAMLSSPDVEAALSQAQSSCEA